MRSRAFVLSLAALVAVALPLGLSAFADEAPSALSPDAPSALSPDAPAPDAPSALSPAPLPPAPAENSTVEQAKRDGRAVGKGTRDTAIAVGNGVDNAATKVGHGIRDTAVSVGNGVDNAAHAVGAGVESGWNALTGKN